MDSKPHASDGIPAMVERLLSACGYSFDIAKCFFFRTSADRMQVYEMHVYDTGAFGVPEPYDPDSFETVSAGETTDLNGLRLKTWIYGHSGFNLLSVDSIGGWGEGRKYLASEKDCFDLFCDDLMNGYLNTVLKRLPKIGSEEELKLWLAAAGK